MGGAYSFVDCLSHVTLAAHPFRDGAPFLLLRETPPTLGRSLSLETPPVPSIMNSLAKKRYTGGSRLW